GINTVLIPAQWDLIEAEEGERRERIDELRANELANEDEFDEPDSDDCSLFHYFFYLCQH
ncbi:MAG: hypothetical protein II011_09190, partial [Prevotella sp.]|nr:hypothetical protein [Prevotella sp.]